MNKTKDNLKEVKRIPNRTVKESDLHSYLLGGHRSSFELLNRFKCTPEALNIHINSLQNFKYLVQMDAEGKYFISKDLPINFKHTFNKDMWQGDILKFGFTSDNHLCNKHERLDVLNLLYNIFEDEEIHTVYNGGNWIDGEFRFNKNELLVHGLTSQIEYAVKHYPYKKDITTYFIAGDDHEGWYVQREGIDIGEYFEMKRRQAGMNDLIYLGYAEADIELTEKGFRNKSWLRLLHAGGGSAYALSYSAQKIVESYQGGEKPSVLLIGHFHKLDYSFPREVHCIQMGCTEDQSLFMRKKRIQAMVGGGIITLRRAADGTINRCSIEFITAYDKKFYIGKNKYFQR